MVIHKTISVHTKRGKIWAWRLKWKTVTKVGVTLLRLPCLQMRNIYPRHEGGCDSSSSSMSSDV